MQAEKEAEKEAAKAEKEAEKERLKVGHRGGLHCGAHAAAAAASFSTAVGRLPSTARGCPCRPASPLFASGVWLQAEKEAEKERAKAEKEAEKEKQRVRLSRLPCRGWDRPVRPGCQHGSPARFPRLRGGVPTSSGGECSAIRGLLAVAAHAVTAAVCLPAGRAGGGEGAQG